MALLSSVSHAVGARSSVIFCRAALLLLMMQLLLLPALHDCHVQLAAMRLSAPAECHAVLPCAAPLHTAIVVIARLCYL